MRVRPPAVAGSFYPADASMLRSAVVSALQQARPRPQPQPGGPPAHPVPPVPKAIVAPHAGYRYSAPIAARAYARVLPARGRITRVVLLGPAHRVPVSAIVAPGSGALATPLGLVRVDTLLRDALVDRGSVVVRDDVHADEHSLEVQLPFLQVGLGDVAVLPLAVGRVEADEVAGVLEQAWGGEETLVVVSTDLSHYHDQASAVAIDRRTASAVVDRQPERLGADQACGVLALKGLLIAARHHRLDVELLDLRTSADAAGDPRRVVGYGAFALA